PSAHEELLGLGRAACRNLFGAAGACAPEADACRAAAFRHLARPPPEDAGGYGAVACSHRLLHGTHQPYRRQSATRHVRLSGPAGEAAGSGGMNDIPPSGPYRSSPVFDQRSLPAALRREHRTKAGVWAVIRVFEGELKLTLADSGEVLMLSPGAPGIVQPDQPHHVEALGSMLMQVDFYYQRPDPHALGSGLRG